MPPTSRTVERLVASRHHGFIGRAIITGTSIGFIGSVVYVFVDTARHGPGYVITSIGLAIVGATLLATIWWGTIRTGSPRPLGAPGGRPQHILCPAQAPDRSRECPRQMRASQRPLRWSLLWTTRNCEQQPWNVVDAAAGRRSSYLPDSKSGFKLSDRRRRTRAARRLIYAPPATGARWRASGVVRLRRVAEQSRRGRSSAPGQVRCPSETAARASRSSRRRR